MRFRALFLTLLLVASASPALAAQPEPAAAAGVRHCGKVRASVAIRVTATRVRCRQARRLMKALLAGSRQCYPHGYTATPRCVVAGFRCRAYIRRGISHGVCVRGRRVARGSAR